MIELEFEASCHISAECSVCETELEMQEKHSRTEAKAVYVIPCRLCEENKEIERQLEIRDMEDKIKDLEEELNILKEKENES